MRDLSDRDRINKALNLIWCGTGVDGAHHKDYLIDQITRVLTKDYDRFVRCWQMGEDGLETYLWETGRA